VKPRPRKRPTGLTPQQALAFAEARPAKKRRDFRIESPTLPLALSRARIPSLPSATWECLRCSGTAHASFRSVLMLFDHEGKEVPGYALALCTFCASTMRACLEHGTTLTPIVMPLQKICPFSLCPLEEPE